MTKTVFLDRDGTVIVDKHYLSDPAAVILERCVEEALVLFRTHGYRLIGVTNQSGVGRGYFQLSDVAACNQRVDELLAAVGVAVEAWFVCPHAPNQLCACRKPKPGLIEQARAKFDVTVEKSFVIGDKDVDVMLGESSGMGGLLVTTGSGGTYVDWADTTGRPYFANLLDAAHYILASNPESR